ncbi:hypothetical protein TSUD_192090 [Trifolium subterraneum]|uniref:Uncharacterized protein n=1 Tax=Trifolium subterraneum TaxID=3900 RepID=A0A2Z6NY26_TRISU|nr:hypothetical protein TSUD_192090 [Trifolium subterraneum]
MKEPESKEKEFITSPEKSMNIITLGGAKISANQPSLVLENVAAEFFYGRSMTVTLSMKPSHNGFALLPALPLPPKQPDLKSTPDTIFAPASSLLLPPPPKPPDCGLSFYVAFCSAVPDLFAFTISKTPFLFHDSGISLFASVLCASSFLSPTENPSLPPSSLCATIPKSEVSRACCVIFTILEFCIVR